MSGRGRRAGKKRVRKTAPRVCKSARAAAGHSHLDAGPDRIVCLLCGGIYRAINHLHLRRIHGFDGEHPVQDYREMFGLEVAVCQESRERARDIQIARHKKAGRHWTRARVLREIRMRRGADHGLAHSRAPVRLTLAARREFGSWDEALRAAGVDPSAHRLTGVWDEERLTRSIRRYARAGHRVSASWVQKVDPELHAAAFRIAGNWTAAVEAAGLDVRVHREPKRWCMERVVEWVRETHAAGGDLRSSAAPAGAVARASQEAGLPWSAFIESLGIPYPGQKKRLDWTNEAVLTELRKRRRRGLPLNAKAVVRDVGQGLVLQARQRFGSWDAALRKAGMDPGRIRICRTWTRADVVAAIRARADAGKSLRRVDVMAEDQRLVRAAARTFPSSWAKALAAAQLDPARPRRRARRPK